MTANPEGIIGIIADFKKLATKIQKDNGEVKKKLREREVVLVACQKEYEKLYYAHKTLKEKYKQLEQILKQMKQPQYLPKQEKVKNWAAQKIQRTKPKKRCYVVDEDEDKADNEGQNEEEESEIENENEVEYVTIQKKNPLQPHNLPRRLNHQKKKQKKTMPEKKKKTQKEIFDFINN